MTITVQELKARLDQGEKVVLVDVREPYEHQDFNIGGTLIPLGNLPSSIAELEPYRDTEVVLYCRSGNRSGMAQQYLQQLGFKKPLNLVGGMLAWADNFGTGR